MTEASFVTGLEEGQAIEVQFLNKDGSPFDISGASALTLSIKRPNGVLWEPTAVLTNDGTDGLAKYVLAANDLDPPGFYDVRGHAVIDSKDWPTESFKILAEAR